MVADSHPITHPKKVTMKVCLVSSLAAAATTAKRPRRQHNRCCMPYRYSTVVSFWPTLSVPAAFPALRRQPVKSVGGYGAVFGTVVNPSKWRGNVGGIHGRVNR